MFLIPGLSQIQTFLVILGIALITGFAGGWYTKGKFVDAELAHQAKVAVEQTQENARTARKVDQQVAKVEQQIEQRSATFEKEIKKHVKPTAKRKATVRIPASLVAGNPGDAIEPQDASAMVAVDCPADVLSVGAVRLLNDASAGRDPDPAGYGNAEGQAPSDVGVRELSEHLNKVIEQYHDLAQRHDALVDWVDSELSSR